MAAAAPDASRVAVVFNGPDPDSRAVKDRYLEMHPGASAFDLDAPELRNRHTISPEEFTRLIRRPVRRFLAGKPGLAERAIFLVLAKGIPHRISDHNHPRCGDDPAAMRREWLERGDFTAASVDSELTLLWTDLDLYENGRPFDSRADGFIVNPYFGRSTPIEDFPRTGILRPKRIVDHVLVGPDESPRRAGWEAESAGDLAARLTPGDLYLVHRIDGPDLASTLAALERSRRIRLPRDGAAILLDAGDGAKLDKGDYARTRAILARAGWRVIHDETSEFLTSDEIASPLAAYVSYGRNDFGGDRPEASSYIAGFRFAPGAVFNTLESFNGRDFGGAGDRKGREQTQLSAFIGAGGTLGIGNVWEPFSFSAAANEHLLVNFLERGMTFGEAAYGSLRALSWQQIVVGDPLARADSAPAAAGVPLAGAPGSPVDGSPAP